MIRTAIFSLILATSTAVIIAPATAQDTQVKGHVRKDGTYVPPHYRTAPNSTKTDNYSSKPNTNPYNGKKGTVDPYAPPKPKKY